MCGSPRLVCRLAKVPAAAALTSGAGSMRLWHTGARRVGAYSCTCGGREGRGGEGTKMAVTVRR